jgi:hypothetical protein
VMSFFGVMMVNAALLLGPIIMVSSSALVAFVDELLGVLAPEFDRLGGKHRPGEVQVMVVATVS